MDGDERTEIDNTVTGLVWLHDFGYCRGRDLTDWVSTFHPNKLPCHVIGDDISQDWHGSFNFACKVVFSNDEAWFIRFPFGGKVKLADEKVAAEVATMEMIRQQTDIPVPEVKAWGLAADNKLGLGPFIMLPFIEGVSLGEVLRNPVKGRRMMREDVSDETINIIYRQIARYVLQLSKLNFDSIGSISMPARRDENDSAATILSRPITLKAHEILNSSGIDVFPPKHTTFASTTDYFNHVIEKDLHHLRSQLNSIDDADDARQKYIFWNVARSLVPRFSSPHHNHGPFKLTCDDFGPMNMLVNNTTNLRIVAVIDWEWSYAGPTELFWGPPWWLCIETPNLWPKVDDRLSRYYKYLDIYTTAIEAQEVEILGEEALLTQERPSKLLKQWRHDGAMWFFLILREPFNGPTCVPWTLLQASIPDFDDLAAQIPEDEVEAFVELKMRHLREYEERVADKKEWYERLKRGEEDIPGVDYGKYGARFPVNTVQGGG